METSDSSSDEGMLSDAENTTEALDRPAQEPGSDIDNEPAFAFEATSQAAPSSSRGLHDVYHPPAFLGDMRQVLFEVKMPIELKPDEFERYWPYVDNIWVRQHKAGTDRTGRVTTDYYACRLQRATYTPKKSEAAAVAAAAAKAADGKSRRNKPSRPGRTCQMRIKTTTYRGEYEKTTISRVGGNSHTHDLDHMDRLKRNSIVMDIARSEVMRGFMPASVYTVMTADPFRIATIGGKFLKTNDVRNSSQAWRQAHPDQPLVVHPGYKWNYGNGVIADDAAGPMPLPSTNSAAAPLNDLLPAALPPPPSQRVPPPSVLDTLHFPPIIAQLLMPYLPPISPVLPGALQGGSLPHLTLTYATSLDSFLSISPLVPTLISGPATKAMTHYLRSRHDAILIGVGTAIADNPTLNCRLAGAGGYGGLGWTMQPRPIIIDPHARWHLFPGNKILQAAKAGRGCAPWIIVAPGTVVSPDRLQLLQSYGGKYVMLPEVDPQFQGRLRWEIILAALAEEEVRSVMVEGGGWVINDFLGKEENRRLVGSVVLTIAPTYLGTGGVVICPDRRYDGNGVPVPVVRFKDVRWVPMGQDIVMTGRMHSREMEMGEGEGEGDGDGDGEQEGSGPITGIGTGNGNGNGNGIGMGYGIGNGNGNGEDIGGGIADSEEADADADEDRDADGEDIEMSQDQAADQIPTHQRQHQPTTHYPTLQANLSSQLSFQGAFPTQALLPPLPPPHTMFQQQAGAPPFRTSRQATATTAATAAAWKVSIPRADAASQNQHQQQQKKKKGKRKAASTASMGKEADGGGRDGGGV